MMTYHELIERVQTRALTPEEFNAAFSLSTSAEASFSPQFRINEKIVDISGVEEAARLSATALAYRASMAVREAQLTIAAAPLPNGTIVAEGDSWFNLPDFLSVPPTLVDHLATVHPVNNIAHWGDTISEMAIAAEYVKYLSTGAVRYFLFSGGGNDALGGGQLALFLRQRTSGDKDPENAPLYVRPSYYDMAAKVEAVYRQLLGNVYRLSPSTVVIIHGYDYCLPRRSGVWLGEPLRFRGFDPVDHRELARAIFRVLLDDFNTRLERLASSFPNVRYVNFRGTVRDDEWWDELHPGASAARRLALLLQAEIDSGPPVGPAAGLEIAPTPGRGRSKRAARKTARTRGKS